jgi:CHASE2 domain-containing sensor protein
MRHRELCLAAVVIFLAGILAGGCCALAMTPSAWSEALGPLLGVFGVLVVAAVFGRWE